MTETKENCQVIIEFPSKQAALDFMAFMDRFGEQTYWEWCEAGGWEYVKKFHYNMPSQIITGSGLVREA